ncbi:two-component sensor histidine kinase [Desulfuromonas versatilis]|uniref:histidine kinase n=1 Tax=Desulfuromonas versatilis TaxID=2802975 RepID=A0ABM8HQZ8_9BACT|nr:ATP-binding protein [Desulfuromonas versatilis]BCR04315.1 two-component sensor histidine kinase [Desulfuromonas versatilis]
MKASSLFVKIFLWFWLAMTLIGAIGVVLALTTDPRKADIARHRERLARQSQEIIESYETGGVSALQEKTFELDRRGRSRSFLFKGVDGPLAGGRVPPRVMDLVLLAAQTEEIQVKYGKGGIWVAMPATGGYVYLTQATPPGPIERLLNPYRLTPRLVTAFVVTGLIAYLLARSLISPIGKLRRATQQFAAGDLATRVGPEIHRNDEIAELARDFDRMAERIGDLVGSQQRLLRDISHELRSPLARLNVALGLARQKAGEAATLSLDRIEREAERLNELIGQLLTLTLLESGAERPAHDPVDLAELAGEVAADADFEARSRNRAVRLSAPAPLVVEGSRELLRRAIENVVRNAVRYTAEGTTVEITVAGRDGSALVEVRDQGPGVAEAALEKLFHPFYRAEDARDRQSGGTGIGLAITERAVRLHGGSVRAANVPGGGLRIEIRLPLAAG